MLRGRCSCAISGRPRPSPALKSPLSPIIPVHPRNSPVSSIIPVHTQKQGGGALKMLSATGDQRSGSKKNVALSPVFSGSPLATRYSALIPIIPALLATATLRVVPAPIFTTTSSIHCRRADNFAAARPATPSGTQTARLPDRVGVNARTGPKQEGGTQEHRPFKFQGKQ